jgi:hypothetical protein
MSNDALVLVEPTDVSLPSGFILYPTLSKVRNGNINFKVFNCSSRDITLHKPIRIGKISA